MANHLPKDDKGMVRVGGPISSTTVALRVSGDTLDPDEVTALLNCSPTRSHRKGHVEIGRKTGHKYVKRAGNWSLDCIALEQESFDAKIRSLLSQVTDNLAVWRAIGDRFSVDMFCGLFMDRSNEGLDISPKTLGMLADRGIELLLDIYGPEFNEDLGAHLDAAKLKKNQPLN